MLASVLNTAIAVNASIQVVRAFVQLRRLLLTHESLERHLNELEEKYDSQFEVVYEAIRELMRPSEPEQRRMGFRIEESD